MDASTQTGILFDLHPLELITSVIIHQAPK